MRINCQMTPVRLKNSINDDDKKVIDDDGKDITEKIFSEASKRTLMETMKRYMPSHGSLLLCNQSISVGRSDSSRSSKWGWNGPRCRGRFGLLSSDK
jgi:hypothetical protein